MEKKKTKLTLSRGTKKPIKNFGISKTLGKNTVIIDKKNQKPLYKGNHSKNVGNKSSFSSFKKNTLSKPNFPSKTPASTSDFERRKLAEQRATKRLRGEDENKDKKSKLGSKKRELKLTVSRALSD